MKSIVWKIHLKSSPEIVFGFLSTTSGREKFWAEKAPEVNGTIHFSFPNGESYESQILKSNTNIEFQLDYFNSTVKFSLEPSLNNGTDLTLTNEGVAEDEYLEVHSGWISVLMSLKAAVDFQIDLRNHTPNKTWDQKYIDN
ncbi:SRPBCC domain-containing protein [Flagellimonas sp. CMM7]|uniref:SRPBCC family protein n=1 Tax=Flagellimonas sp. CMM7 TaxID=2654676 RepID=UPI0013D3D979|nr:SRPBCC domain-containing protein [Flagellimonas sp. CMM7]UII78476.1 SRPBCC domain-containing protein [Flagellimonas sp. CMM7]